MPLTISREQRDAIYELVLDHLTGIGDVWIELEQRDFATAKRQAREFVEDLHLLNDLGWDETIESERVTLTVPPGKLVHILARLHRDAAGALSTYVSRPKDEEAAAERNVTASSALGELMSQLVRAPQAAGPSNDGGEEGSR
jgi:hypothetical protein